MFRTCSNCFSAFWLRWSVEPTPDYWISWYLLLLNADILLIHYAPELLVISQDISFIKIMFIYVFNQIDNCCYRNRHKIYILPKILWIDFIIFVAIETSKFPISWIILATDTSVVILQEITINKLTATILNPCPLQIVFVYSDAGLMAI
jgi:hypothetical protein